MKKTEQEKNPQQLKRKLLSALCMLLIASILMTTTSYAWIVLSVAPEVSGITTNVGANGALEIALLNGETRNNLSLIRTTVGESLATRSPSANNTWGNLVDLSYAEYGLGNILLLPSRLSVTDGGSSVGNNLLSVPVYGFDGRIIELKDEAIAGTYKDGEFSLVLGSDNPDYGVRAIGTSNVLSVQESALALAKSAIKTNTNAAKTNTSNTLNSNGDTLFNLMMTHAMDAQATFTDMDLDAMKNMLNNLQNVLDAVDLALRNGIVAVAASQIGSKDTFNTINSQVMNRSSSLADILEDLKEVGDIPAEFQTWAGDLAAVQNDLNLAMNNCNSLSGGVYTWDAFKGVLDYIMNVDYVYINGTLYRDFDKSSAGELIGGNVEVTLAPGSGIFADIATFIGNYNASLNYVGTNIKIATAAANAAYLTALYEAVKDLEAAGGDGESQETVALTTTYGYALDLAFRCNAVGADLLLQTTPESRIYEETTTGSTMGGGSYMEFSTKDNGFTVAKMLELMDAIRVAFVDDQGKILGIAKLNTSNHVLNDNVVKSPLYLYEFSLSEEDGSILMGERRLGDNLITELTQNVAKAVTAIVWLDGDIVDNTMVSATDSASLYGVLNLQFSTSANLVPADNSALKNLSADKTALETLIIDNALTLEAGQGTYTTVSWDAFTAAYQYANAVYENDNATDTQVYTAVLNLTLAAAGLEHVSRDALDARIDEIRAEMGSSQDVARYVIQSEDGSYAAVGHEEHTQKVHDGWTIVDEVYQVDYTNNLHDEGNGIHTQIYTDASWSALASALYHAEATIMNPEATDGQVNAALTALDTAYESLQRRVFYKPYEYNGRIYYEAICNANDLDTYGKWYDSNFKRIVADISVLNLDAYAEPVDIAEIDQNENVLWNTERITPVINILDEVYPELNGEEILGANWNAFDELFFNELMDQRHITTLNSLMGIVTDEQLAVNTAAAQALVNSQTAVPAARAREVISQLNTAVTAALEAKRQAEAAADTSMTPSQQILLTTAVNTAKGVEGYADITKTDLDGLRAAVTAAEALLANDEATNTQADSALAALNAALVAAKVETVTEYNTLTHSLPVTSEIYDVVYAVEYPSMTLALTGKTGETRLQAIVLTKNGVLFTIARDVKIYTPADGAQIHAVTENVDEKPVITEVTLALQETRSITAEVYYDLAAHNGKETTLGNVIIEGDKITVPFGEKVIRWTWASGNMDIVHANPQGNGMCSLVAKAAGTTYVTVSVETESGNSYTAQIIVTVN